MKYKIIISSVAEAETDQIFLSISQRLSQEKAKKRIIKGNSIFRKNAETLCFSERESTF